MNTLQQHSGLLAAGLARLADLSDATSSRVSSGRRLDRPSVDSAAVGQSSRIDSAQSRLRAVEVNIQNGASRLQATTGQLSVLDRVVTRLSELSALSSNAIQTDAERAQYATEFRSLQEQLRQTIGGATAQIGGLADVDRPLASFNDQPLFGSGPAVRLAIGESPADQLALPVLDLASGPLGDLIRQDATGAFTLAFPTDDTAALATTLRAATARIAESQAEVGAGQSRLDFAAGVAATASTNHEAALSTLRDPDLAADTTALARLQFLTESHTAMLAQAKEATAKLLPLLSRG